MSIEDFKFEPLVGAKEAAKYLGFLEVQVRRMARETRIPSIPFQAGTRTMWKFRLSDLQAHVLSIANGVTRRRE